MRLPPDQIVEEIVFDSMRLIPDMKFTCNGTIVGVKMAGSLAGGPPDGRQGRNFKNMLLQIWRKGTNNYYDEVGDISLPSMCDGRLEECRMPNCYECTVKRRSRVNVEPEDILGLTLPPKDRVRFVLSFKRSMVSNLIFERNPPSTTVNLSNHIDETAVQPLIIVDIDVATETGKLLVHYLFYFCNS